MDNLQFTRLYERVLPLSAKGAHDITQTLYDWMLDADIDDLPEEKIAAKWDALGTKRKRKKQNKG